MIQKRKLDTFKEGSEYKVFITAALEYATGDIHPGHLKSTFLPPQQLHSYLQMRQHYFSDTGDSRSVDSVFIGGLDSHGIHVARKAREEGLSPEEFLTKSSEDHQRLLKKAGINFTHYAPTHIPENRQLVETAFESMKEDGYLVKKEVDGVYCPSCEFNIPPKEVEPPIGEARDGRSPDDALTPRKYSKGGIEDSYCKECGPDTKGKLVFQEDLLHYHLDLQRLEKQILKFLERVETIESVRDYQIKNFQGREPWDFTRENNWGWTIPGTKGEKQFYVWFDAPFGYISALKDYFNKKGEPNKFRDFTQGEKALMYHHIGKDIATHHLVLWPAMLIAYNEGMPEDQQINLPADISVRGHLDVYKKDEEGNILRNENTNQPLTAKMSKSLENAPCLDGLIDEHGSDMVSFYLSMTNPQSVEDTVYDERHLIEAKDLFANKIGNFVTRTLTLIKKKSGEKIPTYVDDLLYETKEELLKKSLDEEFIDVNKSVFRKVGEYIEDGNHKSALEEIMNFAAEANQYIDARAPWKRELRDEERGNILYLCANAVKNLSLLLRPYTPNMGEKIRDMLNTGYEWTWDDEGQIDLSSGQEIGKIEKLVLSSHIGKEPKKKKS